MIMRWSEKIMRNIGKILITLWVCAMLGLVTGMFFSSRIQFAGSGIKYDLGRDGAEPHESGPPAPW